MSSLVTHLKIKMRNGPKAASSKLLLKILQLNGHFLDRKSRPRDINLMLSFIETHGIDDLILIDSDYYRRRYADIQGSNVQVLRHFLLHGQFEGRDPSPLFDTEYYTNQLAHSTPEKSPARSDDPPFLHFLNTGWKHGLDPSRFFKTTWYLSNNLDLAETGINPFYHYLAHGINEGRTPHPEVDLDWHAKRYGKTSWPKKVTLGDMINNYPSVATSEKDYNQRFGYRVLSGGIQNIRLHTKQITPEQLLDLLAPPATDENEIFPNIESAEFLSVDLWDTVLRRDCDPDEIKLQTARTFLINYKSLIRPHFRKPVALLRARFQAEREVAIKDYEYDIRSAFLRWIHIAAPNVTDQSRLKEMLQNLLDSELSAEKRSTRLDAVACRELEAYNKQKYYASDFYATKDFIQQLLHHHGAGQLFTGGFVSCETFETKRSGELYGRICRELEVEPTKTWIHVGDNNYADVSQAQAFGIDARLYENAGELKRAKWFHTAYEDAVNGTSQLHELRIRAITEDIAFCLEREGDKLAAIGARLSPVVIGFILSVLEDAISENVSNLYFFTREGKIFCDVANAIIAEDPYYTKYPAASLLEVSRRSTFGASIEDTSIDDFMRMWNLYSSQSPKSFAISLNLDLSELEIACKRLGLSVDEKIAFPWQDQKFCNLLNDARFREHMKSRFTEQRDYLRAYLNSMGIDLQSRDQLIVVDIGWRGTIQDNLAGIISRPIRGHYLGLFKFLNTQKELCSKIGWLFNENEDQISSFVTEVAPLEMLFNSTGGSVTSYRLVDGSVMPARHIAAGEEEVVSSYIEPIQRGMLEAVTKVVAYVRLHGLMSSDLRGLAQSLVVELSSQPPMEVADAFLALAHNESFGTGDIDVISGKFDLPKFLEKSCGADLHHGISSAAAGARWTEAIYGCSAISEWWARNQENQALAVPVEVSAFQARRSSRRSQGRLCVYAPSPIAGSGGHRTIINVAKAGQALGLELHCFMDGQGDGIELIEEWLGDTPAFLHSQWHRHLPCDYALATVAHSASFVAALSNASFKGYLVQDFEASFNPMSNGYVVAENSYTYGLTHHTVGRWLSHLISNLTEGLSIPSGLGVDTITYSTDSRIKRERSVCFLFQPDKPRRLTEMALEALSIVKKHDPSIKIYAYGSNQAIKSDFGIDNLGLIFDLHKLNALYNKCVAGLCLSLTNPSRIPFEMMAAGCIPVDLFRYNNLFDYADGTAILAYQNAASIAAALIHILEMDESERQARAAFAQSIVRHRTVAWESDVVANTILSKIEGKNISSGVLQPSYNAQPFLHHSDNRPEVRAFCRHQVKLARLQIDD